LILNKILSFSAAHETAENSRMMPFRQSHPAVVETQRSDFAEAAIPWITRSIARASSKAG
jgi:hypothetical protein